MIAGTTPEGAAGSRWDDALYPGLQHEGGGWRCTHWCDACGVRWSGTPDCWICGVPGQFHGFMIVGR